MQKVIVFWRDIPAQVIIKHGRKRAKAELPPRFLESIDRAAMRAGKGGSEAYMADWRREITAIEPGGEMQALADAEATRLEQKYGPDVLAALVRAKGVAETD
jgi:hypothetical protein